MFGIRKSATLTIALIVVTLLSIVTGGTWFALLTGIAAIFSGLWWLGSLEKDGTLC